MIIALMTCASLQACAQTSDEKKPDENEREIRFSQSAIKATLRDPDSASFRNEKIRLLWSKGGKRFQVYCGEVNAANAFGGKAGFQPVRVVLAYKNPDNQFSELRTRGTVWHQDQMTQGHYIDCVRSDTERGDPDFGDSWASIGEFDSRQQAEADRLEPVLSQALAPELRLKVD